jgi:predicted dehydrogenase
LSFELHDRKRYLQLQAPEVPQNVNAILEELRGFAHAIERRTEPPVSFYEAYLALEVAHQVMEKIQPLG